MRGPMILYLWRPECEELDWEAESRILVGLFFARILKDTPL